MAQCAPCEKMTITGKVFEEERALYALTGATVENCTFAGAADGESALKESSDIRVKDCIFALRYPFWHTTRFTVENCTLRETARAPFWYDRDGRITDTEMRSVKCLRECEGLTLERVTAVSDEFGWKCRSLTLNDCDVTSAYFMLELKDSAFSRLKLKGKYSFQYCENVTVDDSELDTKDAFWHARNVTVRNCTVNGEYLGWYSDGLTLVNCRISGTQPLCYCKNLRLIGCTMEKADLAFEYSEVEADLHGSLISVKNPKSGHITADAVGEIIDRDSVMETNCRITIR